MPCFDSTEHSTACYCFSCEHILCISIISVLLLIIILWILILPAGFPSHILEEQWIYCVNFWTSYIWSDLTIHVESLQSYQKLLVTWLKKNGMKNLLIQHTMSVLMILWPEEYWCVLFEINKWIRPDHWWTGNYLNKLIYVQCINKQIWSLLQFFNRFNT